MSVEKTPLRVGVLLSGKGRGSNMMALIEAGRATPGCYEVVVVVSTTPDAPALERARTAGVPTRTIPPAGLTPEELDSALVAAMRGADVDLVCLAGYMRLLTPVFLDQFPDRVLNIHPSLLPAFGGKGFYGAKVHEAVLASGAQQSGVTVHLVNSEYDQGPILLQRTVPVEPDDTPATLAARVLQEEHRAYPEAVRMMAAGR